MPDVNEQWLSSGDCSKCRRNKYCSKPCKPSRISGQAQLGQLVARTMLKAMCGAYDNEGKKEE